MADKRPGGLTALAVFNFIFGGLSVVGVIGLAAFMGADGSNEVKAEFDRLGYTDGVLYLSIALGIVSTALIIASGVGYLKLKRFLGRTLGNVYAASALGSAALTLALTNQSFDIMTMVGLIYPVLTLVLINTTFKDDLVQ